MLDLFCTVRSKIAIHEHCMLLATALVVFGCSSEPQAQTASDTPVPEGTYRVEPHTTRPENYPTEQASRKQAPAELQIHEGQVFSYALPEGWRVAEEGQYAVTLIAPDSKALTLLVGNSGLMPNYPPAQFVYEKLSAIQPENLQLSTPREASPIAGFQQAIAYDVTYTIGGVHCRGVATCHIAPYYGGATMAMNAALSAADQWPNYTNWLPAVAAQIAARNGAAFGMRGLMQQNLRNSVAYGEAAKQYRDWSQRNWQAVTDQRDATNQRQQEEFRENLGAIQTYQNPQNPNVPLELTTQYQHYWMDAQGNVVGTNDPGINPNDGSTQSWQRMEKVSR